MQSLTRAGFDNRGHIGARTLGLSLSSGNNLVRKLRLSLCSSHLHCASRLFVRASKAPAICRPGVQDAARFCLAARRSTCSTNSREFHPLGLQGSDWTGGSAPHRTRADASDSARSLRTLRDDPTETRAHWQGQGRSRPAQPPGGAALRGPVSLLGDKGRGRPLGGLVPDPC